MKVYLAGKITGSDWRAGLLSEPIHLTHDLFPHIDEHHYDSSDTFANPNGYTTSPIQRWKTLKGVIVGGFDYVGPYFTNMEHSPRAHDTHGNWFPAFNNIQDIGWEHGGDDLMGQQVVAQLCLDAISRADVIFAWIDRPDIYGTIAEIGYARGLGKPVWIGFEHYADYYDDGEVNDELWFVKQLADEHVAYADSPRVAWERCLKHYQPSLLKHLPYREYLRTAHWEETRKKALERARYRCQACNTPDDLHVHHRTYERRGMERDDDLTVLCRSCHSRVHGLKNGRVTRMPVAS